MEDDDSTSTQDNYKVVIWYKTGNVGKYLIKHRPVIMNYKHIEFHYLGKDVVISGHPYRVEEL